MRLTDWGRVTHICVSKLIIIGADIDGAKAIIWTSAGIIVNWTPGGKLQWHFNRNSNIFIQAFENVLCEVSSVLCRPQCVQSYNSTAVIYNKVNSIYRYIQRNKMLFLQVLQMFLFIHLYSLGHVWRQRWSFPGLYPSFHRSDAVRRSYHHIHM